MNVDTEQVAGAGRRPPRGRLNPPLPWKRIAKQPRWIVNDLLPMGSELKHPGRYVRGVLLWRRVRQKGYTMLGCRRGRTLYSLAREADRLRIPGALVDCGVWNGGSTALLSAGAPKREVYAFDSFEGLPDADEEIDGESAVDRAGWCLGVEDNVRDALTRFGSRERLHIVKGWFADTFPDEAEGIGAVAVLHADGDWYASVALTLETFYEQVSPGGFVVVDDYGVWSGARRAVDEFREANGVKAPLQRVGTAACWQKAVR
jgi:hypothetical protein